MTVEIRELWDADMRLLAKQLRPMDRREVIAMLPEQPLEEALVNATRDSVRARTGLFNGKLVACWGVAVSSPSASEGAPWLLATDSIEDPAVRRAFLKHGTSELNRLVDGFQRLWNLVHKENELAKKWLKFMGFEFLDPREYLVSGEPFLRFEMECV